MCNASVSNQLVFGNNKNGIFLMDWKERARPIITNWLDRIWKLALIEKLTHNLCNLKGTGNRKSFPNSCFLFIVSVKIISFHTLLMEESL